MALAQHSSTQAAAWQCAARQGSAQVSVAPRLPIASWMSVLDMALHEAACT